MDVIWPIIIVIVVSLNSVYVDSSEDSCERKSQNESNDSGMTAVYELLDSLRERMVRLEERQKQFEDRLTKVTSVIGFSAYMDNGYFYPRAKQVIPFTAVISNFGHHYNKTTSTFTCPVRGVYNFWFNLYTGVLSTKTRLRTSGELLLDEYKIAEAYCYNESEESMETTCGNSIVTECNEGSKVWVQSEYSDSSVFGSPDKETTFSGFMINEL